MHSSVHRQPGSSGTLVRCLLVSALLLGTGDVVRGQDDGVRAFRHRPDRVPVGRVLHYVKSNIDGSKPEQLALYVADSNRLEALTYRPGEGRAGLVIAIMDWRIYSAARLERWQLLADGKRTLVATVDYDGKAREVVATSGDIATPERIAIPRLPMHVYDFDLGSLNITFAHLFRPEEPFTIGIASSTFTKSPVFAYRGDAAVTYTGRSIRNGRPCRTYSINGAGLAGRGGTIWVNAADDYVEDMEIALPNTPEQTSFKLELVKITTETNARWQAFQRANVGAR